MVNRDGAFLSLLTAAQSPTAPVFVHTTCCNPFGPSRDLFQHDVHARFAAAVTVCGLKTKLEDDREDNRGLRRLLARNGAAAISKWASRAENILRDIEFPFDSVQQRLKDQSRLEREVREGKRSPWDTSGPTAESYSQILGHSATLSGVSENRSPLEKVGASLGRIIYLLDARQDLESDKAQGAFNPMLYGGSENALNSRLSDSVSDLSSASQNTRLQRSQDLIHHILVDGVANSATGQTPPLLPHQSTAEPVTATQTPRRRKTIETVSAVGMIAAPTAVIAAPAGRTPALSAAGDPVRCAKPNEPAAAVIHLVPMETVVAAIAGAVTAAVATAVVAIVAGAVAREVAR